MSRFRITVLSAVPESHRERRYEERAQRSCEVSARGAVSIGAAGSVSAARLLYGLPDVAAAKELTTER